MKKITRHFLPIISFLFILSFSSCKDDEIEFGEKISMDEMLEGDLSYKLDPYGRTPLAAQLNFISKYPSRVSISVMGEIPVHGEIDGFLRVHHDAILGLYPNSSNEVQVTITDAHSRTATQTLEITTSALYEGFPEIKIEASSSTKNADEMILSDLHFGNAGFFTSYPIVFDQDGIIRYCLDLREAETISWPTQRLQNGNLAFVQHSKIIEMTILGKTVNEIDLGAYHPHHDFLEMPNGNFLVAVNKAGTTIEKNGSVPSVEDHIIEVGRSGGSIVQEWDMRAILDVSRIDVVDGGGDWFHMNGIDYSEADDCIVVSGRNQGVVKVDRQNNLKWILAAHKGWGKAGADGNGEDTNPFLLTALDNSNLAYDSDIQEGSSRSNTFDWAWGQHAPSWLENGNLLVFDNGLNRQFSMAEKYSRAVEYEINETDKTIKEVWAYGESRGSDSYSSIISNADYYSSSNTALFAPGFVNASGQSVSRVVEVSYPDNQVVFEASLIHKNLTSFGVPGWGTIDIVYRSHRFNLYP